MSDQPNLDHEYVDVGFIHPLYICKHCDRDRRYTQTIHCHVLVNKHNTPNADPGDENVPPIWWVPGSF